MYQVSAMAASFMILVDPEFMPCRSLSWSRCRHRKLPGPGGSAAAQSLVGFHFEVQGSNFCSNGMLPDIHWLNRS